MALSLQLGLQNPMFINADRLDETSVRFQIVLREPLTRLHADFMKRMNFICSMKRSISID